MDNLDFHAAARVEAQALAQAFNKHGLITLRKKRDFTALPLWQRELITSRDDDILAARLEKYIFNGIDLDAEMPDRGLTAFDHCLLRGMMASLRVLIRAGAKTNWTRDQELITLGNAPQNPDTGDTDPFDFACRVGNLNAAKAYFSSSKAATPENPNPLISAVHARSRQIVEWLMDMGWDPNAQNNTKWSPLCVAVILTEDADTAELLVTAGASLDGQGGQISPVDQAATDDLQRFFMRCGINPARFVRLHAGLDLTAFHSLPKSIVTQADFDKNRSARPGRTNPEPYLPPFWSEQLRTGNISAPKGLQIQINRSRPIWSFVRYGRSVTVVPDGGLVFVGGEHEDYYDADFCIYADVTVLHPDGSVNHFIYPEDIFPPTDYHSATLVGDHIWLVGALGYPENRIDGYTQVLRLDTRDFSITPVETSGDNPGWLHGHLAVHKGAEILVTGGTVEPGYVENTQTYALNLSDLTWRKLTSH